MSKVKANEVMVKAQENLKNAIEAHDEMLTEVRTFERKHEAIVDAYKKLLEGVELAEDATKKAMGVYAALVPELKSQEFVQGYRFVRPLQKTVSVSALLKAVPALIEQHVEIFNVNAKSLDALVDMGEIPATVRREVVVETLGTPSCYTKKLK